MLTLLTPKLPQKITGYLAVLMLVVVIAGCGGGSGGDNGPTPAASQFDVVVARVGPVVAVRVGETADLNEQNSINSSSEPLSYSWSFAHKPDTSNAVLLNPNSVNPSFVADVRGTYLAQLVVSAGGVSSKRAIQLVVATVAPERPTGPFNHQGLSSGCSNCHNDEFGNILSKAGNHAAAGNICEACHTPLGFAPALSVDHQEVLGDCSQCHDGVIAVGKSGFHMPTDAECDDCHTTDSFLPLGPDGKFDHSGISRACTGCHNGIVAIGMTPTVADTPPGTHPDTTSECGYCHTTVDFLNPYPDHTGPLVNGPGLTCDTCHGVSAIGTPAGHPDTSPAGDCIACHSIVSFNLDGVFNHRVDPTVLACEVCHTEPNSINALGRTPIPPSGTHPDRVDCESCHNVDKFLPPLSFDHTGIVTDCAQSGCHTGLASEATGTHTNHLPLPTAEDCSVCHSPGTFITGTFAHDVSYTSVLACSDCHNEVITVGKFLNHFPTPNPTDECDVCHDTIDFAGATFDHLGIDPNNCTLCHDGAFSTTNDTLYGKPSTHVPSSQDCSLCHTTTEPFNVASPFNHTLITGNCESCHNGNLNYVAVGAIDKKVNHIPSLNSCFDCHTDTSTDGFASPATYLSGDHSAITSGCQGCHISKFLPGNLIKGANHLPTSQDCSVCHTVAGLVPSTFDHIGITGNCVSCHNGTFATGKVDSPTPHVDTSADCGICHSANLPDFTGAFVDHSDPVLLAERCDSCHGGASGVTEKGANHVVTTEDCRVCHVAGGTFVPAVFNHTGIVDNCVSCHNGIEATGTDAKPTPPGHIPITQDCSACHVPTAFAQANFNHQDIVDNCVICHDGTIVLGKNNDHVPTNGDCAVCHQTTGFLPAEFSHVGIDDNCSFCHDAGFATPKTTNHVATNQDCGVCHNPSAFIPATFDHTGIVNGCASCHDGNTATGMVDAVPAHLTTSLDCHFCHTTATFAGGSWVHDSSTANNCDTCHVNGGGATPMPTSGHLNTSEQCDVCHNTNGWAPTSFSHSSSGDYPGNHRKDPGCTGCHNEPISGSNIKWKDDSSYAPYCAACHARDFEREGDHIGGKNGTVAQNKDCSGGGRGCHKVSDKDFD